MTCDCPSAVHKQARQLESVASQMRDQGNKLEACMGILTFCFCLSSGCSVAQMLLTLSVSFNYLERLNPN